MFVDYVSCKRMSPINYYYGNFKCQGYYYNVQLYKASLIYHRSIPKLLTPIKTQQLIAIFCKNVLTHSTLKYSEKLTFKKKKKTVIFNGHISKTRTNLESRQTFSESLIHSSSKQRCFRRVLLMWVHGRGFQPPTIHDSAVSGSPS